MVRAAYYFVIRPMKSCSLHATTFQTVGRNMLIEFYEPHENYCKGLAVKIQGEKVSSSEVKEFFHRACDFGL